MAFRKFIYRFFVLLLCFAILSIVVDLAIVNTVKLDETGIWIMLGINIGLFVIGVVVNELLWHFKNKREKAESENYVK